MCGYSKIFHTHSLFIQTFHQTPGVHTFASVFFMASKIFKSNSDAKGKSKATTSTTAAENPFTLVSNKYVKDFELKHQSHLVVKQFMWKQVLVGYWDIPGVIKLVEQQQIDYFLKLAQDYNEDLILVFYSSLHEEQGSCFKFSIGNKVYQFTNDLWKTLFGIIVGDADVAGKVDMWVMDLYNHVYFNWNVHLNEILKAPRAKDCYDHITTGHLKGGVSYFATKE